jgi:hypothetical protein
VSFSVRYMHVGSVSFWSRVERVWRGPNWVSSTEDILFFDGHYDSTLQIWRVFFVLSTAFPCFVVVLCTPDVSSSCCGCPGTQQCCDYLSSDKLSSPASFQTECHVSTSRDTSLCLASQMVCWWCWTTRQHGFSWLVQSYYEIFRSNVPTSLIVRNQTSILPGRYVRLVEPHAAPVMPICRRS